MAGEKGSAYSNAWLLAIFNAVTFANMVQNAASPITSLYLSLHTADPTAGGNQSSNEASYTGYARIAVLRTSAGWTVSGNQVTLTGVSASAPLLFGADTVGGGTFTYIGIGTASSGAGTLLYAIPCASTVIGVGNNPAVTGLTITET